MKAGQKFLLILIGAILIGLIATQVLPNFFNKQNQFETAFSKAMQTFNKKQVSISLGITDSTIEKLSNLTSTQLQEIQKELSEIETKSNTAENRLLTAENRLISTYITLVNLAQSSKKLKNLNRQISELSVDNVCSSLNLLKERSDVIEQSISLAQEFNSKANSFSTDYPSENQKAKLQKETFDAGMLNERKNDLKNSAILLEESCEDA